MTTSQNKEQKLEEALGLAEATLRLIATPARPDGTYNRCRQACEIEARNVLDKINSILYPSKRSKISPAGIYCKSCDAPYGHPFFFLWVDDEIWEDIGMKRDDYLCAHCTIDAMRSAGLTYGYLFFDRGSGKRTIKAASISAQITDEINSKKNKST